MANDNALDLVYSSDTFSRLDESDDAVFYARDRFVSHLDEVALATVERVIGTLIVEDDPVILDLMASWDSHIPKSVRPLRVIGLGLNQAELTQNPALTESVLHDLNHDPHLPFPDETFDVVLNTVSVDYLTRPFEVFREVGRILKPGGLFLVIFSNRLFPQKAVKIWRESSEEGRVIIVQDYFREAEVFEQARLFVSKGKPRPADDKYAHYGIPSDPVFACYAEKKGLRPGRKPRPTPVDEPDTSLPPKEEVARRKALTKDNLECPYCSERLCKWTVPQTPFTEWDNEFMYICFNDLCPYLLGGWEVMNRQGNFGLSYRLMYNPERDTFLPVPVPSLTALRESIVEEVS